MRPKEGAILWDHSQLTLSPLLPHFLSLPNAAGEGRSRVSRWARCCVVLGQEGSQRICRGWRESGLGERVRVGPPGWHPGIHQVVRSPGARTPGEGMASQAILQDCGLPLDGQTALCPCSWPAHGESSEHSRDQGRDPGPDNSIGLSWERPPPAAKVGHPWAKPTAI